MLPINDKWPPIDPSPFRPELLLVPLLVSLPDAPAGPTLKTVPNRERKKKPSVTEAAAALFPVFFFFLNVLDVGWRTWVAIALISACTHTRRAGGGGVTGGD